MTFPQPILHKTAFELCLDWIRSTTYKDRVRFETFRAASSLWQKIEHDRKHSGRTLWEQDNQLLIDAICYAHDKGWIRREFRKLGRRRTKDFSPQEQAEAEYKINKHLAESTIRRLWSQAGENQPDSYTILTINDGIFAEYLGSLSAEQLQNLTRGELQELTGFNQKINNRFYNWLRTKGWSEKLGSREKEDGGIVRVRVIYQEDVHI